MCELKIRINPRFRDFPIGGIDVGKGLGRWQNKLIFTCKLDDASLLITRYENVKNNNQL